MPMRILITGGPGAGASTVGRALAARIGATFVDADDFFWIASDPPCRDKREAGERLAGLLQALDGPGPKVVAGSVVDWGDPVEDAFSLVVYLWVPADVRLARLFRRETARFGRPQDGFLDWAAQYDEGRLPGRSRPRHEKWLAGRTCPVLRIEGDVSVPESESRILGALSRIGYGIDATRARAPDRRADGA